MWRHVKICMYMCVYGCTQHKLLCVRVRAGRNTHITLDSICRGSACMYSYIWHMCISAWDQCMGVSEWMCMCVPVCRSMFMSACLGYMDVDIYIYILCNGGCRSVFICVDTCAYMCVCRENMCVSLTVTVWSHKGMGMFVWINMWAEELGFCAKLHDLWKWPVCERALGRSVHLPCGCAYTP